MRFVAAPFVLLLGACATPPVSVVQVSWEQTDNLKERCGSNAKGCYRLVGQTCVVITGRPKDAYDIDTHATLGHEVRHCFEGDFHPAARTNNFMEMNKWRPSGP